VFERGNRCRMPQKARAVKGVLGCVGHVGADTAATCGYQFALAFSLLGSFRPVRSHLGRLCQLIWILLHKGVRYEEWGPAVCEKSKRVRTLRMIRTLRNLGYRVEPSANLA